MKTAGGNRSACHVKEFDERPRPLCASIITEVLVSFLRQRLWL
jgi:hypothetical protein